MVSVDMCEHGWPGSGCKDCDTEVQAASLLSSNRMIEDLIRKLDAWSKYSFQEMHQASARQLFKEAKATIEDIYLENLARQLYQSWRTRPGYVPWVEHGNSEMQEMARRIIRKARDESASPAQSKKSEAPQSIIVGSAFRQVDIDALWLACRLDVSALSRDVPVTLRADAQLRIQRLAEEGVIQHKIGQRPTLACYAWQGDGPEPPHWYASDGTLVFRSYEDYCDD